MTVEPETRAAGDLCDDNQLTSEKPLSDYQRPHTTMNNMVRVVAQVPSSSFGSNKNKVESSTI